MTELKSRNGAIRSGDPGTASEALVECLPWLFVAGRFAEAHRVALALLADSQVALPKGSVLRPVLCTYLPTLSWAIGIPCPKVDEQPAIALVDIAQHLAESAGNEVGFLVMNDAYHRGPPAVDWCEAYFEDLDNLPRTSDELRKVGAFTSDLSRVLQERVAKALNFQAPDILSEIASEHHPELMERARGFPAPEASHAFSNRYLAARLAGLTSFPHFGRSYLAQRCWTLLAILFLVEQDLAASLEQLAYAFEAQLSEADSSLRPPLVSYIPFIELYRTGGLASTVGASVAAVSEMMLAFEDALSGMAPPDQAQPVMDWSTALSAFSTERSTLIDDCTFYGSPVSSRLKSSAAHGDCLVSPAANAEVEAVEVRLGIRLPPSYREFLRHSNGLVAPRAVANLLPIEEIDWFRAMEPDYVNIWTENDHGDEVEDSRYFVYGKHQDSVSMRSRYLLSALQISDVCDGDVILLNPEVRFGEEWEAWHFGCKLPGAIRFRSFAELMKTCYFVPAPQW